MVRLQILLLSASAILATAYSLDTDDLNTKAPPKPDAKLIYSVMQRRRHKAPHEETKAEDVERYYRKPPQTTTVPSIFSMKVENTFQHVYPNERVSDKQIHSKRNQTNVDNTGVSSKSSIIKGPAERIVMRTKNISRRIPFAKRYHLAVAQPITNFNDHHLEEQKFETESTPTTISTTTTTTTTSTTPESVALDITEKEQTREESVGDSKNLFSFPSRTLEISEDIMAENQNSEELSELKFTTTTTKPISTTMKTLEENDFVPASIYVPNIISQTRRRRPHFVKKVNSHTIKEILRIDDNVILSTSAPIVDRSTETEQGKKTISPSHESNLPTLAEKPKLRRRLLHRDSLNRGSQKFSSEELRRQQTDTSLDESGSTSTQGIPSTPNFEKSPSAVPMTSPKPPPVPTLSPWYDGFGK